MRLTRLFLIVLLGVIAPIFACSSTKVEETWKAPDVTRLSFEKVLVVATSPSPAFRHEAEDAMAEKIKGPQVIKSYEAFPVQADVQDRAKVEQFVRDNGVDGIIVMRVVSNEKEVDYVAPSYPSSYYSFSGYYGPNYGLAPFYYDQGYVTTHRVIGIETNVYQGQSGRLLWSVLTKTWDPDNNEELLKETVEKVHDKMKDQKLVP